MESVLAKSLESCYQTEEVIVGVMGQELASPAEGEEGRVIPPATDQPSRT